MDALELLEVMKSVDIPAIAADSLRQRASVMADLNAEQLARGERATGAKIKPEYAPLTKELKKGRSGLAGVTDRVTLFDTGAHYRELYAEISGDEFEMGSKNWKEEKLEKKYGAIYGLTDESIDELSNSYLRADFIEQIHEITGL